MQIFKKKTQIGFYRRRNSSVRTQTLFFFSVSNQSPIRNPNHQFLEEMSSDDGTTVEITHKTIGPSRPSRIRVASRIKVWNFLILPLFLAILCVTKWID